MDAITEGVRYHCEYCDAVDFQGDRGLVEGPPGYVVTYGREESAVRRKTETWVCSPRCLREWARQQVHNSVYSETA